jgi:hypothetical protein
MWPAYRDTFFSIFRGAWIVQGSHVLQFGDMVIDEEPAADYLGQLNTGTLHGLNGHPLPYPFLRLISVQAHYHEPKLCKYGPSLY